MVDGSSRMRVIIMTDVVYSHFPSHHLFCEVENPPTLSLRYRRALRSGAKPCHNLFSSANTGNIYSALSFSFSPSLIFCFHLRSLVFLFAKLSFVSIHLFPSSLFPAFCFHCCCVDTAMCGCCEHMQDVSVMHGRLHCR